LGASCATSLRTSRVKPVASSGRHRIRFSRRRLDVIHWLGTWADNERDPLLRSEQGRPMCTSAPVQRPLEAAAPSSWPLRRRTGSATAPDGAPARRPKEHSRAAHQSRPARSVPARGRESCASPITSVSLSAPVDWLQTWDPATVAHHRQYAGQRLSSTASDQFGERDIAAGDRLFVAYVGDGVAKPRGHLFLIAAHRGCCR
jgi:hypothetical protein